MFPNMEYIKTVLNGIGQRLADVSKRAKRGNWTQNDSSAWDYIENRPGGYDAETTTDYIIDRSNTPIIYSSVTYFSKGTVVAQLQLVSEETVPAGNWENVKVTRKDGSFAPNAEVFNPSKDISYVSADGAITDIDTSKTPWVVMVRTARAKWLGITFELSGTYFFRAFTTNGSDLTWTEQISLTYNGNEPIKIPNKYLDVPKQANQIVYVNVTGSNGNYTADKAFNDILDLVNRGYDVVVLMVQSIYQLVDIPRTTNGTHRFSFLCQAQTGRCTLLTVNPENIWTMQDISLSVTYVLSKADDGIYTLKNRFGTTIEPSEVAASFGCIEYASKFYYPYFADSDFVNNEKTTYYRSYYETASGLEYSSITLTGYRNTSKPWDITVSDWKDIHISGTDISLDITGAAVGQTVKISAVDTDGKPTAWEPVDMPSLPTVNTSDNGKFMRVVNGAWAAAEIQNANGEEF